MKRIVRMAFFKEILAELIPMVIQMDIQGGLLFIQYCISMGQQQSLRSHIQGLTFIQIAIGQISSIRITEIHWPLLYQIVLRTAQITRQIYNSIQQILTYILLKIMDKAYTPQKDQKSVNRNTAAQSYMRKTPDSVGRSGQSSELALLKDYESLKIQVRQLQAKNRTLSSEVEQLLYQKSYNESKFAQKMSFQEETLAQFHKEKNYQMEMLQIKHEEEASRQKRESELRADEYLRDMKHKDYQLKEKDEQIRYLELRCQEIKKDFDNLDHELMKSRDQNAISNENLTHAEFRIKKLEMLVDELQAQKQQMESEIRVLLDIEAEKSRQINSLEIRLHNSEDNERRLTDKLNVLSDNFNELEDHISIMKSKLLAADEENHSLAGQLDHANFELKEKERQIIEQNDRENQLRIELEQHQKRESRREREVAELISENERLYKQLNYNRHRLHEMGIVYGFDV